MLFTFSKHFGPERLTVIPTLMAVAATEVAKQHIRSNLGFLPKDTSTCRPGYPWATAAQNLSPSSRIRTSDLRISAVMPLQSSALPTELSKGHLSCWKDDCYCCVRACKDTWLMLFGPNLIHLSWQATRGSSAVLKTHVSFGRLCKTYCRPRKSTDQTNTGRDKPVWLQLETFGGKET